MAAVVSHFMKKWFPEDEVKVSTCILKPTVCLELALLFQIANLIKDSHCLWDIIQLKYGVLKFSAAQRHANIKTRSKCEVSISLHMRVQAYALPVCGEQVHPHVAIVIFTVSF